MTGLEEMSVQGKESSLMLSECVCGGDEAAVGRSAQPATCPECGDRVPRLVQPARPARQERRHLQDFLSAFV